MSDKKMKKGTKIALCVVAAVVVLLAVVIIRYFTTIHAAEDVVYEYYSKTADGITVSPLESGGVFIDSPSTGKAVIYYPGCKVEYTSYIPFCYELAKQGYDVFIPTVKLNFALFDKMRGQEFLDSYDYDTWILMGHSMGGIAIASLAEAVGDKVQGLVLLGAHGPADLTGTNIKTLVMYGSEDGVVQRKQLPAGREKLAKPGNYHELEIEGANHAGWAHYGSQAMDGEAFISREEQFKQGIEAITALF
ncbi:MAG: alpha/beta hydrolase [Treponemataceae bacterium]|nr:alpha/beta hydrolase [Treponemataceae bacterium]